MAIIERYLADEAQTERLGADIAMALKPGDTIALKGDLGAGKTTLARGLIRHLAGDNAHEVPSPTYTLCQSYVLGPTGLALAHFDLYRIGDPDDVAELGLDEAIEAGVALVEWPERAGGLLPEHTLTVELAMAPQGGRIAKLAGGESGLGERITRSLAIRDFLNRSWHDGATRRFLQGDASTRRYETATLGDATRVLMDAPRQPDGPPVTAPTGETAPYSRIAHLAEDVTAFVAIDELLRAHGFAAPELHGQAIGNGLLLIEHLGSQGLLDRDGKPIAERYLEAARLLARLQTVDWPSEVTVSDETGARFRHTIARYDRRAMLIEVSLLADWYVPAMTGEALAGTQREAFFDLWADLAETVAGSRETLVLRDYHSPNLIWRGDRAFPATIGLIDFQDAVMGPAAYDVASLAQDARVDISPALERAIVDAYREAAMGADNHFDNETFERDYAIMAAQRTTKILGIFVRLDRRDGKPAYLRHLPRMRDYLARSLAHPALSAYRAWRESVPGMVEAG